MAEPGPFDAYRRILKRVMENLNAIDLGIVTEGALEDNGFSQEVIRIGMEIMEKRGRPLVPNGKTKGPRRSVRVSKQLVTLIQKGDKRERQS